MRNEIWLHCAGTDDPAGGCVRNGDTVGAESVSELSITDYDEAIMLNPADVESCFYRGVAYAAINEYVQAIADFDEAIRLNPTSACSLTRRSATIADFDEAIRLNPSDVDSYSISPNSWKSY
jgi:tetratricopeptide (TPR) repeat protein